MSYQWKVGDKAVCVDASQHDWNSGIRTLYTGLDGLTKGTVYTIEEIYDFFGRLKLILREIERVPAGCKYDHKGFDAARFRPVTKTSIDIFQKMLAPAPKQRVRTDA